MTKVESAHGVSKNSHQNEKNCAVGKKKHQRFIKLSEGVIDLVNDSQTRSNKNAENQKNGAKLQTKLHKVSNKRFARAKASYCGWQGIKMIDCLKQTIKEEPSSSDDGGDAVESRGIKMIKGLKQEIKEELSSSDDGDDAVKSRGIKMIKVLKQEIKEKPSSSDNGDDAVKSRGIKMIKDLKQEIKEEPSSSDDGDDAVKSRGIKMIKDLKQEIKEEPSSGDNGDDAVESRGIKMIKGLKQEIKEEPSSGENDDGNNADKDAVENIEIKMIESLKQEIKEELSDDDNDDENCAVENTGIKIFEGLKREIKEEPPSEDDEDAAAALPSPSKISRAVKSDKGSEKDAAKKRRKFTELTKEEREECNKRTVFIGNVLIETDRSALQNAFSKFGIIESMRVSGIVPEDPIMLLRVVKVKTVCYFITYKEEDSVKKALSMNGKKWDGNILRVDNCKKKQKSDKARAVFLGNLPFIIEDNEIWEVFKECGPIDSVRIIRDRKTGLGRGIGFVNFKSADGVALAMDLNETTIRDRKIRVKPITPEPVGKNRREKRKLKRVLSGTGGNGSPKKLRIEESENVEVATHNNFNAERSKISKGKKKRLQGQEQRPKSESSPEDKVRENYQGQKADAKNKPKQNKSAKKKKQMAAKLLAMQAQETRGQMSTALA